MPVVALGPEHCDALLRFFAALPDGDLTFIREEVHDPDTVRSWASGPGASGRWVAVEGEDVTGYVAVRPLPRLARHALVQAVGSGLSKLVVEVVAEQGAALALFTDLGFTGEALLVGHIRDRNGELRDLMVLAHHVHDTWAGMDAVGVADELRQPG